MKAFLADSTEEPPVTRPALKLLSVFVLFRQKPGTLAPLPAPDDSSPWRPGRPVMAQCKFGRESQAVPRCPARKHDWAGNLRFVRASGGVRVFVDQAVEDGFSADPLDIEVGHGGPGSVASGVGDALSDALVRPGGVVVGLVLG